MYHYIKDFSLKKNKGYKGLSINKFKDQINYLQKKYDIIDIRNLFSKSFFKKKNKKEYCLLTFDDGYVDHYENVFPILQKKKLLASFYMSGGIIENRKLLNVNKIHYILANLKENEIIKNMKNIFLKNSSERNFDKIFKNLKNISRYDNANVNFIKFMINQHLSSNERDKFFNLIFKNIIQIEEKDVCKTFYLNLKNISEMKKSGMYFGGHGYQHFKMTDLNSLNLDIEINKTIKFLKKIKTDTNKWIMCYPYGSFNNKIIEKLLKKNCFLGLTTVAKKANINSKNFLSIPRFDAKDVGKLL